MVTQGANNGPPHALRAALEDLYAEYNRPELIGSDPLQFVVRVTRPEDREVVGLIASSLAFGGVRQISGSVERVLEQLNSQNLSAGGDSRGRLSYISEALKNTSISHLERFFCDWRHRYVRGEHLCDLLRGTQRVLTAYGSLENCFLDGYDLAHETVVPALSVFVDRLRAGSTLSSNYLLPSPDKGSACKRLNLFLRWMVRRDAVDPGGWSGISPSKLVIPLDTHMHRISLMLGLTKRRPGDLKTALEITRGFSAMVPDDPVRYDFCLTRLGILREMERLDAFL